MKLLVSNKTLKKMAEKPFIVQIYGKVGSNYILQEENRLTTKTGGINQFNAYVDECNLNNEEIEKLDDQHNFIWRLKTNTHLLILRKDS